jgi:excisionase family DNA binding protein
MSPVLMRDVEALQQALSVDGEQVSVSLSRGTVEMLTRVVEAQAKGQEVLITHGIQEVSPAEAALLLGMSRPQVRKLMEHGKLTFRMVGTHHRISLTDIQDFLASERKRRKKALTHFSAVENELGLVE